MSIGGKDINITRFHIHLNCAEALNSVNDEPNIMFSAEISECLNIVSESGSELYMADCQSPCPCVDSRSDILDMNAPISLRHHARLNTVAFFQTPPWINIGRKFDRCCDDIVPISPLNAIGCDKNTLCCILHKCDFCGIGIDEVCCRCTTDLSCFRPLLGVYGTVHSCILYKACHRVLHPTR